MSKNNLLIIHSIADSQSQILYFACYKCVPILEKSIENGCAAHKIQINVEIMWGLHWVLPPEKLSRNIGQ